MGCEGDGSGSKREGGKREGEKNNILYFLSTNLKFEAFLDGEEEFSDQDRLAKGTIVCILCLQGHYRGLLPFSQERLERRRKKIENNRFFEDKKRKEKEEKGKGGGKKKRKQEGIIHTSLNEKS